MAEPGSATRWTPLEAGTQVGAYRVERFLGPRGMSLLYDALDAAGERVTLKVIKPALGRDPQFRRRFLRQSRAAAEVEHRHIVGVLDSGEHEGLPYLAQAYVSGMPLDERLRRSGPLPVDAAVRLLLEIAAALDALHGAGLVHREVSSAVVLLGDDGSAYISELGLAKVPQASVLTRPGQALGALNYVAPEQIRGEDASPAADVYGLGCVMFECLCGAPPFADREGMRVLWAHLQDPPPDPSSRRPEVSAGLSWAVLRALEKAPEARPPTAVAYARMVQAAAEAAVT